MPNSRLDELLSRLKWKRREGKRGYLREDGRVVSQRRHLKGQERVDFGDILFGESNRPTESEILSSGQTESLTDQSVTGEGSSSGHQTVKGVNTEEVGIQTAKEDDVAIELEEEENQVPESELSIESGSGEDNANAHSDRFVAVARKDPILRLTGISSRISYVVF